jgi:mRNA-degrading endonuclease RelE of RelBE toxin-antitoxin system
MASMPNEDQHASARAVFFTNEFKRNLRQLARKYRRIKTDIQPVLDELEQGGTPGDRIPGVSAVVYKIRVRNSDSGKGKRGGYRILYQVYSETRIILVTVYSKTEQADITSDEIRSIIDQYSIDQTQETEQGQE